MNCLECDSRAISNGLCGKHYYRANSKRPPRSTRGMTDQERFAHYTQKTDSCWLWIGTTMGKKIPCFAVNSRSVSASRYAFEQLHGRLPEGNFVRHHCQNTLCVNPGHMYVSSKPNDGPRRKSAKLPTWHMSVNERFMHYVEKTETCWLWRAATFGGRYGAFGDGSGKTIGAHRYSYMLHKGPIPDGMYVCHTCDNPRCVNPDHLFLGTPRDNAEDRENKGRSIYPRGDKHHLSKLTDAQVEEILLLKGVKPQSEIARMYGVDPSHISRILSGRKRAVKPPLTSLA